MATGQDDSVEYTVRAKALKVFDLRATVTGYVEGELKDWPPNIQDAIYAAMERCIKKARIKGLDVLQSSCGRSAANQPYEVIVTCCETKGKYSLSTIDDNVFTFRKPINCPWCNHTLTAAGDVFEAGVKPEAGDTSMCIECGKFSFFLGVSELRKATYEEFRELLRDPRVMIAWLTWKQNKKAERDHNRG